MYRVQFIAEMASAIY